jgi:hypothetical protein
VHHKSNAPHLRRRKLRKHWPPAVAGRGRRRWFCQPLLTRTRAANGLAGRAQAARLACLAGRGAGFAAVGAGFYLLGSALQVLPLRRFF